EAADTGAETVERVPAEAVEVPASVPLRAEPYFLERREEELLGEAQIVLDEAARVANEVLAGRTAPERERPPHGVRGGGSHLVAAPAEGRVELARVDDTVLRKDEALRGVGVRVEGLIGQVVLGPELHEVPDLAADVERNGLLPLLDVALLDLLAVLEVLVGARQRA